MGFLLAGGGTALADWPGMPYAIHRAGLYDPEHTGASGRQYSAVELASGTGHLAGFSLRSPDEPDINLGQSTWIYDPITNTTVRTGLIGAGYASSTFQYSANDFLNAAGQVAGRSNLVGSEAPGSLFGTSTWVYNTRLHTTVQTGLVDAAHTGSNGLQLGGNSQQNALGQVAGWSMRTPESPRSNRGRSAWLYNPVTNTTTQVGLTGGEYTSVDGRQVSQVDQLNDGGMLAGFSNPYAGDGLTNGNHTWVYNSVTGATVRTGLTGPGFTGSGGYQESANAQMNTAGQVAGISARVSGQNTVIGRVAWVFNPGTNTTVQIGLTDPVHTFTQLTEITGQNDAGHVVGFSHRYFSVAAYRGVNTWLYNPATNTTARIGLTDGAHTGSSLYQYSLVTNMNGAGQVVGYSLRSPEDFEANNGTDAWMYDTASNTTTQLGLSGPGYTGTHGFQESGAWQVNAGGQVVGWAYQIVGERTRYGAATWVYNPATHATVRAGLSGPAYTGSAGYQYNYFGMQNDAGQVAGSAIRVAGERDYNGLDAWYFDPATSITHHVTLGIADTIRTSDNFAASSPSILTDDGYLFGTYSLFLDGGSSESIHAFIYRPDLGFGDLGELVSGGLSAAGWQSLLGSSFAGAADWIVGHGLYLGQGADSQSVYVLRLVPAPGCVPVLLSAGAFAVRRRRGPAWAGR